MLNGGGNRETFQRYSGRGIITDPFLNNIGRILAMDILETIRSGGKHGHHTWTDPKPMCDSTVGRNFQQAAQSCLELIQESNGMVTAQGKEIIDKLKDEFITLCTETLKSHGPCEHSFTMIHTKLEELNNKIRKITSKHVAKSKIKKQNISEQKNAY